MKALTIVEDESVSEKEFETVLSAFEQMYRVNSYIKVKKYKKSIEITISINKKVLVYPKVEGIPDKLQIYAQLNRALTEVDLLLVIQSEELKSNKQSLIHQAVFHAELIPIPIYLVKTKYATEYTTE